MTTLYVKAYKVSDKHTGDCPRCDNAPCHAFTVKHIGKGYFEACSNCLPKETVRYVYDTMSEEINDTVGEVDVKVVYKGMIGRCEGCGDHCPENEDICQRCRL